MDDIIFWIVSSILGIAVLTLFVMIIVCIVLQIKLNKEGKVLISNWEMVKKLKETNSDEFIDKCFTILEYLDNHWTRFAVTESKHGKGWMVVGEQSSGNLRFWPSFWTSGEKHKPEKYLTKKEDAEKLLLNVMEDLCDYKINHMKEQEKLNREKED